jgi:hypothetical protein
MQHINHGMADSSEKKGGDLFFLKANWYPGIWDWEALVSWSEDVANQSTALLWPGVVVQRASGSCTCPLKQISRRRGEHRGRVGRTKEGKQHKYTGAYGARGGGKNFSESLGRSSKSTSSHCKRPKSVPQVSYSTIWVPKMLVSLVEAIETTCSVTILNQLDWNRTLATCFFLRPICMLESIR